MGTIEVNAPMGYIWERTNELRIARNLSHRGREERLQQRWFCRETGDEEWRDVPTYKE